MKQLAIFLLLVLCTSEHTSGQDVTVLQEVPSRWVPPPGDPLEHSTSGFAKVLCSSIFITGRDLETAADEDGFFVSKREERKFVVDKKVDYESKTVSLTLPNGVVRRARHVGGQGCISLPNSRPYLYFEPMEVQTALPPASEMNWPMGDRMEGGFPEGIDEIKVQEALEAAFDPAEGLTAGFVAVYKGQIIAEGYQEGLDRYTRLPSWSMGKSLTATLMGQLIHQGVYELWQPAPVSIWQGEDDPRKNIRIGDIVRMSSGLRFVAPQDPDYYEARGYPDHLYVYTGAIDAHQWAISRPAQWPPNTVGRYRNSDPLALNYLIKQAVVERGEEYLTYPQRYLFDKLGIQNMVLETDVHGNFLLQGYEYGTPRDWARLGMLYMQDGVWEGERLLPEGWVDFVRTPAPAWEEPEYGGMFWLNRTGEFPIPEDAYFMAGAGGQFTILIPTHDLVVVRLGHYKGSEVGREALDRALVLLLEAIPPVRDPWQP